MYHNHIDVVYPRDIYLQPHKDFTHYKTDHHWTEYGAFLGYKELMKEIKKKHQEITILEESDFDVFYKNLPRPGGYTKDFQRSFNKGSDCRRLGITDDCPLEYAYKYYNHKDMKNKRIKKGPLPSSYITEYEKGTDKKVTIVGNSYGGYLMEFLPFTFKNVQWLRTNNNQSGVKNYEDMRRFEKHIVDFNTDILIYYMASPYVLHLQDMY